MTEHPIQVVTTEQKINQRDPLRPDRLQFISNHVHAGPYGTVWDGIGMVFVCLTIDKLKLHKLFGAGGGLMEIYTDGSCNPNPGKGGWSFVLLEADQLAYVDAGHEALATNNKMEMLAVLRALEYCVKKKITKIVIWSDSQLTVNIFNKWMYSWEQKGWVKKDGGEIKNLDLVKLLFSLKFKVPHVELKHCRGHVGIRGNELADKYANIAAAEQRFFNE